MVERSIRKRKDIRTDRYRNIAIQLTPKDDIVIKIIPKFFNYSYTQSTCSKIKKCPITLLIIVNISTYIFFLGQ